MMLAAYNLMGLISNNGNQNNNNDINRNNDNNNNNQNVNEANTDTMNMMNGEMKLYRLLTLLLRAFWKSLRETDFCVPFWAKRVSLFNNFD